MGRVSVLRRLAPLSLWRSEKRVCVSWAVGAQSLAGYSEQGRADPVCDSGRFHRNKHTLRLLHCRAYEALTLQPVVESDCKFEPWSHVDLYAGARH